MERLTDQLSTKCSMDPWDWCGLDGVCKRDCFKPTPCKIPKLARRLAEYEDTGLEPKEIKDNNAELVEWRSLGPLGAIEGLVKAQDAGRLVVLPCKIGNPVFRISNGMVFDDWEVAYADVYKDEVVLIDDSDNAILEGQIGKEVFFTRAEAEAALARKDESHA